ncbi:MAG: hypothetical protein DLM72_16680 [Candidatus Nitrosopolaris wilkensis]|nr:MAG: hypothetical protein DLM72_16680 [Candidatus Nitrosopolaris wilkensis]
MSEEIPGRKGMIQRAVLHYAKRIRSLTEDKDEQTQPDIFKNDLLADAREAELLLGMERNPIGEERSIVCLALTCYISDLNQSKEFAIKKLGNINLSFKDVDRELKLASDMKDEICWP